MKDFQFKNVYEWTLLAQYILIGMICLFLFYLGYFFDFSSLSTQLQHSKQQEQDLKNQFVSLFTKEEELKNDLKKYPLLVNTLDQWKKKIITQKELSELINEILKIGVSNGLTFENFNPAPEIKKDEYIKIPVKAVLKGSYDQIASFISQIANMDYLVVIGDFNLAKEIKEVAAQDKTIEKNIKADDKNIKADITLEIYEGKKK